MPPLFGISSSMVLQRPISDAIDLARRHDLPAFEVWADHPHAHPDETSSNARVVLRRELAGFARVSVHGPLGNVSLASINPGIWRESVRQYLAAAELAHDIGAAVLVVHPGDLRDPRFFSEFARLSEESIGQLARRAAELGVFLAVENCGPYHAGIDRTASDLASIVRSAGSPQVKVCLDTGHAAVNRNMDEIVKLLGRDIVHLHVHDNHGQRDEHLPIGRGTIDYTPLEPVLPGFDGMAIAEVVWEEGNAAESPDALLSAAQAGWDDLRKRLSVERGVASTNRAT